jgi:protein-S-isoprenylcysteine O-methyltransferase Ste14
VTGQSQRGPDLVAPPPLLYLCPLAIGALLDRVVPLPSLPRRTRRLGYPLVAGGVVLGGWFARTMHAAKSPIDPRQAPTALVVDGPFRHSRNPGYIAFTLIYTGVALATGRRWPLVFLPAVIATVDHGVVRREERYLSEQFGEEYDEYRRRVPRWLSPDRTT